MVPAAGRGGVSRRLWCHGDLTRSWLKQTHEGDIGEDLFQRLSYVPCHSSEREDGQTDAHSKLRNSFINEMLRHIPSLHATHTHTYKHCRLLYQPETNSLESIIPINEMGLALAQLQVQNLFNISTRTPALPSFWTSKLQQEDNGTI